MTDPLKARLAKLQKFSDSAKRRANLYSDIAKMDGSPAARSLGALQKAPAPGKKLQKIGFLMLWIPEPTGVTCAIGGPMIVAVDIWIKNTIVVHCTILVIKLRILFLQLVILEIL